MPDGTTVMEYKRFHVQAFERKPGKWRAAIRRVDGKPVKILGRKKLAQDITNFDAPTAAAAVAMAMTAIDAGSFVRDRVATERFWRRHRRSSNGAKGGDRDGKVVRPAPRRPQRVSRSDARLDTACTP
jgi:hypothetical protein